MPYKHLEPVFENWNQTVKKIVLKSLQIIEIIITVAVPHHLNTGIELKI
jgi:hypothetical protein